MFDMAAYRPERPGVAIGVALADGFTSCLSLAPKVAWIREMAPFRFVWVAASGTPRE